MFNFGDVVKLKPKESERFLVVGKIPSHGYFLSVGKYLCIDYEGLEQRGFFLEEELAKISEGEYECSIVNPIYDPNFSLGDVVDFKNLSINGTIIAINPVVPPHNYTLEYLIMTDYSTLAKVSINEAGVIKLIEPIEESELHS